MMTTQGLIGIHKLQGIEEIFNYEIYDYSGKIYKTTNAILIRLDNVNSRDMTDEETKIYEDILEEATEEESNLFDNSRYVGEGNELILTADEARAISDSISDRFNDEEKELVKSINTKILKIANKGDYLTTYDIPIDPEIHFDKIRNFYVQNGFGCAAIYGDDACNTIQLCWQER